MSSVAITAIPQGDQAVLCVRCLDRGHKCYASHVEHGKALCIYCLDNEPCFHEQRQIKLTQGGLERSQQRPHKPSEAGSTPAPATNLKPIEQLRDRLKSDGLKPEEIQAALLAQGYKKREAKSVTEEVSMPEASTVKPNGHKPVPEKLCVGFERVCGNPLGERNRTGLCAACYARRQYRANYSADARKTLHPAKKNSHVKTARQDAVPPVSGRVTLQVTEEQLNQFLVRLSLEDKQRLANYFLETSEVG